MGMKSIEQGQAEDRASNLPFVEADQTETTRGNYNQRCKSTFRGTVYFLIVAAAVAVLVAKTFITNTYKTPGNKLPQTGLLWWPVLLLSISGLILIVIGVVRKKGDDDEK